MDDGSQGSGKILRDLPDEKRRPYWLIASKTFVEAENLRSGKEMLATSLAPLAPRSGSLHQAVGKMGDLMRESRRTLCHEWAENWHSDTGAIRILREVLNLEK